MLYGLFKKVFLNLRNVFYNNDKERLENEVYPENVSMEVFSYENSGNKYHQFNLYKLKNDNSKKPLIIDIHGGAWVYGDKDLKRAFCSSFVERGYDVISLSYRLIDDVLLKDMVQDIFSCMRYIEKNHESLGVSLDNVFITGDSAGGHLSILVTKILCDKELAKKLDIEAPNFKITATLTNHPVPFTDVAGRIHGKKFLTKYVAEPGLKRIMYGKNYKNDIWFQLVKNPTLYINKDDGLPPFILVTSEKDNEYHYQSVMLKEYFDSINLEYGYVNHKDEHAGHVFNSLFPYTEISKETNDIIDTFFKKNIK